MATEAERIPPTNQPYDGGHGDMDTAGKITPEKLAELRARIGIKRQPHRRWNSAAGIDTIRHFAEGMGDLNPLWSDPEYGAASVWGRLVAPPTYIFSLAVPTTDGLRGVHALFGGSAVTWHQPLFLDDSYEVTVELVDIVEHKGRISDKMYRQIERMEYVNQRGQIVAEAEHWAMRFERHTARDRLAAQEGRYTGRQLARYTAEGIKGIDDEYAREEARGAPPLFYEDVEVGDYVPQVVKGPLRITDILAFLMGSPGPYIRGHRANWAFRQEHPRTYVLNPQGIPDVAECVHWEPWLATGIATPGVYDYGTERPSWMSHAIHNWMGDSGFLEYLRYELRSVNVVGDTTRVAGRVTDKRVEDGKHLVDLEMWSRNQLGEVSCRGTARVRLPARDANDPGASAELDYDSVSR